MKKYTITFFALLVAVASCEKFSVPTPATDEEGTVRELGKFEPQDGKCFLIIGQDLGAVGGFPEYNEGYCDTFPMPAGITSYMTLVEGSPGGLYGMDGVKNWGSGDVCLSKYVASGADNFSNCMIAIGLNMVGQETLYTSGNIDNSIKKLADWLNSIAPRPVFLRIGYEFDGYSWNHYTPETYVPAFRYLRDKLEAEGVTNVAYVWQSAANGTPIGQLEKFYPGDDYVDWCAYSYFSHPDKNMLTFARSHGKPVFLAESTPTLNAGEGCYLSNDAQARWLWDNWFEGILKTIRDNDDIIKAWHYINVDWYTQSMWKTNPTFMYVDSRIQISPYVSQKWKEAVIDNDAFIQSATLDWSKLPQ